MQAKFRERLFSWIIHSSCRRTEHRRRKSYAVFVKLFPHSSAKPTTIKYIVVHVTAPNNVDFTTTLFRGVFAVYLTSLTPTTPECKFFCTQIYSTNNSTLTEGIVVLITNKFSFSCTSLLPRSSKAILPRFSFDSKIFPLPYILNYSLTKYFQFTLLGCTKRLSRSWQKFVKNSALFSGFQRKFEIFRPDNTIKVAIGYITDYQTPIKCLLLEVTQ